MSIFFSCPNGSKLNFNRKKITDIFWNFEFPTRFSSDFHFSHPSFCLWVAKGWFRLEFSSYRNPGFWHLSLNFAQKLGIGPTFHAGHFGPVTQPLPRQKMSDFDSITSYGSVQVSAAQICKNFENRYVRTRDMGKKLTENGHFWAQFWPNSCPV